MDSQGSSRCTAGFKSVVIMLRASCCWLTNGMRYVLAELGSVPSVPEVSDGRRLCVRPYTTRDLLQTRNIAIIY